MDRKTEELLCELQAQLCAQRIALCAIARTHPDPAGLLSMWREALREATTHDPVALPATRHSDYLAEQLQTYAEHWTAELVDLAVADPHARPLAGSP